MSRFAEDVKQIASRNKKAFLEKTKERTPGDRKLYRLERNIKGNQCAQRILLGMIYKGNGVRYA